MCVCSEANWFKLKVVLQLIKLLSPLLPLPLSANTTVQKKSIYISYFTLAYVILNGGVFACCVAVAVLAFGGIINSSSVKLVPYIIV